MPKTKILYLSHSLQIGGAEVCLRTLVKSLNREQFEPVVVFPADAPPGPLRDQINALGIRTLQSPLEWWIRPEAEYVFPGMPLSDRVSHLIRLLEAEHPDIIHTNTSVLWEGALAASQLEIPHVWHVHEILDNHPSLRSLIPLPLFYATMPWLSAQVVVVSEAAKATYATMIPPAKLTKIWNGLDWETQSPDQREQTDLRTELHLPNDAIIALAVGGLLPEKGYDILLAAMAQAAQRNTKLHLVIAGAGKPSAIANLKQQIGTYRLESRVHPLGYRSDVPQLLAACDFLVQASRVESFSLTIVEAMAAGKPAISTRSGGPTEIIREGITGWLTPLADSEAMATKIGELASDANLRYQMGQNAQLRFEENFRADVFAAHFETLYQSILANPKQQQSGEREEVLAGSVAQVYQELYQQTLALRQSSSPIQWQIIKWRKQAGRMLLNWRTLRQK